MKRKTAAFPVQYKAVDEQGIFEAIVSVFGNVDLVGDRVVKGAFTKSLEKWQDSGDPIPVIFSHQWDDLNAHVGEVLEAEERDEGLWVKGQLDLEMESGRLLHKRMKRRTVKEFSFAYDVVNEKQQNGANELLELDIIEVGPTLKGANPDTELLAVKSGQKAYVTLDGSVEDRLRDISSAVRAWGDEKFPADEDGHREAFVWPEATFDDRVIVSVEKADGNTYYEIAYTAGDGIELGEAREVVLRGTVEPKSRKAGRVLSTKNETKLQDARDLIDDVLSSVSAEADAGDAKVEEPDGAKAEEPIHRAFALAELEALTT